LTGVWFRAGIEDQNRNVLRHNVCAIVAALGDLLNPNAAKRIPNVANPIPNAFKPIPNGDKQNLNAVK
jgi:hypothetical protein